MEPRSIFWKKELVIPNTQWIISGYSRSAYRTGFYITGLNIMLDGGPQCFKNPNHVFITHTHADHIAEIPFTLINDIMDEKSKPTLYCPDEAKEYLKQYIMQLHNTNSLKDTSAVSDSYYNLVPIVQERAVRRLTLNKQLFELETVGADHSVPTVVYGFSIVKDKLNPLYLGLTSSEKKELKKTTCITVEVVEKKFCYVLDTSIKVLEDNPFLLEYPVVIIECTFLMDDEVKHADLKKHIHWLQLKPYVVNNPNVYFILTHFSLKYRDPEIRQFFENVVAQDGIQNIYPWLTDSVSDPNMISINKLELESLKETIASNKLKIEASIQNIISI
jgi:ribonuclease Z